MSCSPENDDRSCFACFEASLHIRQYKISIHIQTRVKAGVITPTTYHNGRISLNSHIAAVSQLFQNIGIIAKADPIAHPTLIIIRATFFVMYLGGGEIFD